MICEDEIMTTIPGILDTFTSYVKGQDVSPLFMRGDALSLLEQLPSESIDFCVTSPPYWNKRQYHNGGIGLEKDYHEYISDLLAIFSQVKRILKPTGSFWLNIGDSYCNKTLIGIP